MAAKYDLAQMNLDALIVLWSIVVVVIGEKKYHVVR
jgi:hypothetical protein